MIESPLWTREEAAHYLRCHPTTVSGYVSSGLIDPIYLSDAEKARPRFTKQICDEFIERRRQAKARARRVAIAAKRKKADPKSPWEAA